MDKIVSYNEFLKHKSNLEIYLKNLFDIIPELNVYFPANLSSEDRHLIYTKSKGYLFEKLHKVGSKYSIKLWKPCEKKHEDYLTDDEEKEEYDFKEHLYEISNTLEKQHDMMLNELHKCQLSINRVECILKFITGLNLVGMMIFLT